MTNNPESVTVEQGDHDFADSIPLNDEWRAIVANMAAAHRHHAVAALTEEVERWRGLAAAAVDAWDWWNVDTYDRCSTVPGGVMNDIRAALQGAKP